MTEDEMAGWDHGHDAHECEQTWGVSEGQRASLHHPHLILPSGSSEGTELSSLCCLERDIEVYFSSKIKLEDEKH